MGIARLWPAAWATRSTASRWATWVDFIDTVFISFPTFNVADIGVTCGFVLFFAGMLWSMRKDAPAKEVASEEK